MPKSVTSHHSLAPSQEADEDEEDQPFHGASQNSTTPTSPVAPRKLYSVRTSDLDLRCRLPTRSTLDEQASLLAHVDGSANAYQSIPTSTPGTPGHSFTRQNSYATSPRLQKRNSRHESFGLKLSRALGADTRNSHDASLEGSRSSLYYDDRVWYDQFTSTDWVHDSIADAFRVKELRSRKDFRGRLAALFDSSQGWILVAIIGCLTALIAYFVDVTENAIFDYKTGYCSTAWYKSKRNCCSGASICDSWVRWSATIHQQKVDDIWIDFAAYIIWAVLLATLACIITLRTKTTISSVISLSTLDENLGADCHQPKKDNEGRKKSLSPTRRFVEAARRQPMVYYPAAGSGVAEVKVILSGFVLHGYLGVKTLVAKTLALSLSVGSGLSIGKEGPYVHIATCVGNVACRLFPKYNHNDGKRREVLSASAASGVAVAFGAPIGGVLFSLEEVSYYFPPKTLFRTFFCCIVAALSLRFLDPYGTNKIVLFEVRYLTDWKFFEMIAFILLGVLGGVVGALFIKASRFWARTFRRIPIIKAYPLFEVALVALITGLLSFWNRYTRLPVAELLFELASPCNAFSSTGDGLCPTRERIPQVIWYLCVAFVIKAALTTISFGIKVPAGIYVPSMVVGGLLGRIVGHCIQHLAITYPDAAIFGSCPKDGHPEACVVPGVYALVAAGATMCGVTRLSVTLAVILFELTGSLEHVLPFSIGVLISKWTADALEPLSIYVGTLGMLIMHSLLIRCQDLLTDMNAYPYLDAKVRPVFTGDLGEITPQLHDYRLIDISSSPLVPATLLRSKLEYLHMAGELDSGLPIIRDGILVGLIPAPDLEFALDKLVTEDGAFCLMSMQGQWRGPSTDVDGADENDGERGLEHPTGTTDFTPYVDPAPVALEIHSPMDLVFECFVKLGLRYICVLKEGRFAGLVHKKAFVKYIKELEQHGVH
ncbi:hypothetical protein LTR50_006970 [Elasticomyces elasticus]|nr:hypothetical protein LTR50_006970 [Elasticomyces elasticus]